MTKIKLKTLEDFYEYEETLNGGISELPEIELSRNNLKKEAIKHIKDIQNGSGVKRDNFPEYMKGSIVKDNWNNSIFTIGIEYGYIIGIMNLFNITKENLK